MLITIVVSESIFFAERVVALWNSLPADTDFSSLNSFKRSISTVDFSKFLIVEV